MGMWFMSRRLIHGIVIGLVSMCAAVALWKGGLLDWLELPMWDWRVRTLAKPSTATDKIRLIMLDQQSLDWGNDPSRAWKWPWPRQCFEPVLAFCRRGGAKAVGFDFTFTEPSESGVTDDQALGNAIAQSGDVILPVILRNKGIATNWPSNIPDRSPSIQGLKQYLSWQRSAAFAKSFATFPIPEVATNAAGLADVYSVADQGGVVRRARPFAVFDRRVLPSLSLATYLVANTNDHLSIAGNELTVGRHKIPLDKSGNAVLRYRGGSQTHKTENIARVIRSELLIRDGKKPTIDPSFFKNCYVFIGSSASGLLDLSPTPLERIYPSVEIHATFLDNLLSDDFARDPPVWLVVLSTLFFSLVAGIAGRVCNKAWQTVVVFAIVLPLPIAEGFALYNSSIWMPMAVQETAATFALVGAVLVNYAVEGRQKRFIKSAFKQYLSPVIIERLTEHPEQLKLGGESRELTIYFSDVRGFTTISEGLDPEHLTALLNDYLSAMSDIIMSEGGYIDKYEGDAVIAFWNAPLDLAGHADCGVRAALLCQKKLAEIRPVLKERYGKDLFARIGMNTGKVTVGNMGSTQRFNYTFLGDAGNLAARLEGINKQFGTDIMISEYTARQLSDEFALREISKVTVVGKKEPVRVFVPMFKQEYAANAAVIEQFGAALQMFYKGDFKKALEAFSRISDKDAPAEAYVRQCRKLIETPPVQWDGVWEITEK